MFNRLIIAVLTLGLLLTFSSAAFSSNNAPHQGMEAVEKFNPSAPKANDVTNIERPTPAYQKPAADVVALATPTTLLPPQYFCEFIDYSGGAAAYFWRIPDSYGDQEMGMRFTAADDYDCTLLTTYIGVYGTYLGGSTGTPDMKVTVYDDDGFGFPGTVRGSVVVPFASLPTSGLTYVPVDLTTLGPLVYSDGAEYHVGVSVDNFVDGDTLAILSDDGSAGLLRSWEDWAGFYGLMWDDWGLDCNFLLGVDVCCGLIPFTDCEVQDYSCGAAYFWKQPDAYGDDYFNMRFSVEGPETLQEVGVALYASPTTGAPDLDVYVWGGDGSGFPDLTQELAKVTIPYASLQFFPNYNVVDLSALNLVLTGDFFVGWSTNGGAGDTLAGLSDDGSCGTMRSSEYWGGMFGSMLNDWGVDVNFLIYAYTCRDQFSQCKTKYDYCNLAYFWRLPDRYGDVGDYQKFSPDGQGCRLDKGRIAFYDTGDVGTYTTNSGFQVWSASAVDGLPETMLAEVIITPADYVLYPGMTEVDFSTALPDPLLFDGDIWFGVESYAPDTLTGIRTLSDDGSCGSLRSCENWAGSFYYMFDDWGVDVNFIMEIDVCCVPFDKCTMVPGDDWPVMGKNFARVTSSTSDIGPDAQGTLTKAWQYTSTQVMVYATPVIYSDTVVGYYLDHLVALDINNGTEIWNRTADGFEIGGGSYCTPTVFNFDGYGVPMTMVFVAGGDSKAFSAIDLATGATVWTRNFMDHSMHFMTFGASVIVDCGGTPVIIYNDDDGDVYAVNAITGVLYGGWAVNPANFGGSVLNGMASDGSTVYVGTDRNITNGNITAVDACTGAALWDLASSGGLQLDILDVENPGTEGFTGAPAYEDGAVYAASYYDVNNVPPYQSGGVMYSINAGDGSLNWAGLCIAQDYGGISVDVNQIIHTGWAPWVPGYGEFRGPTGFAKETGNKTFANTTTQPGLGDFWLMSGVLSCENDEEANDWYVTSSRNNYVGFYENVEGAQLFHRRFADQVTRAGHKNGEVMDDAHLLVTWRNKTICLTSDAQVARPRLDIPSYSVDVPVEFGSPDHFAVVFPGALGNNGGDVLTIDSLIMVDDDNGTIPQGSATIQTIDSDRLLRLADKFGNNADKLRASMKDIDADTDTRTISKNHSAFAIPSWVYGILSPAPGAGVGVGEYVDIVIDINGTQVPRGITEFFVRVYNDDPDYFLDSARIDYPDDYLAPQMKLGIIGGCLYSDVVMEFGVGAANYWHVWNSPMITNGDITSCDIDGDDASFWQGAYIFAREQTGTVPPGKGAGWSANVYHYARNWSSATPQDWTSLLPDPNCYDATCPPNHRTNVLLGDISTDDGASYHAVYGEVVAYAFVDSGQDMCDYDTLGNCLSWSWRMGETTAPPYRDTMTAGFTGCAEVIGAYDEPLLNNFVIHRFDLEGRYGSVDNLFMGAMLDMDLGPDNSFNNVLYDEDLSLAYVFNCNMNDNGWGAVRIPFGCDYEPMRGTKTITANMGAWNDSAVWLDSVYIWLSTLSGATHQPGTDPATCASDPDDREQFFSIAELDVPGPGSDLTIGMAWFGLPVMVDADLASSYADLANTANKWCGFGRGDLNNDGVKDLVDIAYLIDYLYYGGNGPFPFMHLGDVNADGVVNAGDVAVMTAYYFDLTGCISGTWTLGGYTAP